MQTRHTKRQSERGRCEKKRSNSINRHPSSTRGLSTCTLVFGAIPRTLQSRRRPYLPKQEGRLRAPSAAATSGTCVYVTRRARPTTGNQFGTFHLSVHFSIAAFASMQASRVFRVVHWHAQQQQHLHQKQQQQTKTRPSGLCCRLIPIVRPLLLSQKQMFVIKREMLVLFFSVDVSPTQVR